MISQRETSDANHLFALGDIRYPHSKVPTFAIVSFRPHRRPTPFVERSRRDKPPVWGLSSSGFSMFYNQKDVQMIPNVPFYIIFHISTPGFIKVFLVFTLALYQPDVRRCVIREMSVRGTKTWFPNEPRKHQVDSPQYHLSRTTTQWKEFQILSRSHCIVWQ